MTHLDWEGLCHLGISRLRLKPDEFWALTPAELQMMAGPAGPRPLEREGLSTLMARFPDILKDSEND